MTMINSSLRALQKRLEKGNPILYNENAIKEERFLQAAQGRPFWIADKDEHKAADETYGDRCCWNHLVGLPKKGNEELPIFDYEMQILKLLDVDKKKYIWIKKSTGLGISEFFLRYIAFICTRDNAMQYKRICVVTGPRVDLAVTLIDRLKAIISERTGIVWDTKETVFLLNHCIIEAYPSHHIDSMRGLTDVKLILIDEGDFFPPGEQENARIVSERYIGKSDPIIAMVSTPNLPGGLFEKIELEDDKTCIYHRLHLPYTVGLGKIYTEHEIEEAMKSPSFAREYNLAYGYGVGNVVTPMEIEMATKLGEEMKHIPSERMHTTKTLGIDAGYGSSKFAFVISEFIDNKVRVIHSREFERAHHEAMVDIAFSLIIGHAIDKVYVDAANVSFIKSLKKHFGDEIVDYERDPFIYSSRIVPISFGSGHGAKMISHLKFLFGNGLMAIDPVQHQQLITQIRVARTLENGGLDKSKGNLTYDLFDAFRLSLLRYTQDGIEVISNKRK